MMKCNYQIHVRNMHISLLRHWILQPYMMNISNKFEVPIKASNESSEALHSQALKPLTSAYIYSGKKQISPFFISVWTGTKGFIVIFPYVHITYFDQISPLL
jgi:hypothetical protein